MQMQPWMMGLLRGFGGAVVAGLIVFFQAWSPDDSATINNAVHDGMQAALAVLSAFFGFGLYDQQRAARGIISTADVPMAAASVQVVESGTGGVPVPDQRQP